jgi:restriction system protein
LSDRLRLYEAIRTLDWFQFEKLITIYYQALGYEVSRIGGANADGGVDLIIYHESQRYVVQCKHWKNSLVKLKDMREFLGTLADQGNVKGYYVTLCGFTDDARAFAAKHNIELCEESNLIEGIVALDPSARRRVEAVLLDSNKYCPKCESIMIRRVAKSGFNTGKGFWGCSRYPKCRYILRTEEDR